MSKFSFTAIASSSSIVVEYPTQLPTIEGSGPGASVGTEREKMTERINFIAIKVERQCLYPGKPYLMERLGVYDLLLITSLGQLLFKFKCFTFATKQAASMWRSTVLSLTLQLVFPA
jgi:hypothetical protein